MKVVKGKFPYQYYVSSETKEGVWYFVRLIKDKWVCNCPLFTFSKPGFICKHIIKAKEMVDDDIKKV